MEDCLSSFWQHGNADAIGAETSDMVETCAYIPACCCSPAAR